MILCPDCQEKKHQEQQAYVEDRVRREISAFIARIKGCTLTAEHADAILVYLLGRADFSNWTINYNPPNADKPSLP